MGDSICNLNSSDWYMREWSEDIAKNKADTARIADLRKLLLSPGSDAVENYWNDRKNEIIGLKTEEDNAHSLKSDSDPSYSITKQDLCAIELLLSIIYDTAYNKIALSDNTYNIYTSAANIRNILNRVYKGVK